MSMRKERRTVASKEDDSLNPPSWRKYAIYLHPI